MRSQLSTLLAALLLPATATAQFDGDYYSGTDFESFVLSRQDFTVDFDWDTGSPAPSVPSDDFSVRWTGTLDPPTSETYTFFVTSDDGVRLWVDGSLVIDDWTTHSAQQFNAQVSLTAGSPTDVTLEFFESSGEASCVFEWSSPTLPRQLVRAGTGGLTQLVPVGPFLDSALPARHAGHGPPAASSSRTPIPTCASTIR